MVTNPSSILRPIGLRVNFSAPTQPYQRFTEPQQSAGGAALLRAGGQVGDAVDAVGNAFEKLNRQDEALTVARMRAEDRTTWSTKFNEAKEKADIGAPDFTSGFLKDFDAYAAERLAAAPSPLARRDVEMGLIDLRGRLAEEGLQFEAGARLAKRRGDVEQIRSLNGGLLARDHRDFATVLADTENSIRTLGLPPAVQAQEIEATRATFAETALMGLASRDPAAAMTAIKSGAWDGYTQPDRLVRLYDHANTEDRRRRNEARAAAAEARAEARSILEPQYRDAFAAAQDGAAFTPIPEARLVNAYGPERGRQMFAELEATRKLGQDVKTVAMVPPDVQDRLLASYAPDGAGYAGERERYGELARAVARDRKNREDPAAYVLSNSSKLRDLVAGARTDPTKAQAAVALSLTLQADAGIPEVDRRILPVSMADTAARQLATLPPEARADAVEGMAATYGEHWPRVFRELVAQKLPTGYEVLATVQHPTARKELAEAQAIGRDDLRKAVDKNAKLVDDGVRAALEPLIQSLALQPGGAGKIALWEDQTRLLAYRYALTMPPADAAKKAADEIALGKYDFVPQDGGLQVRAPKGQGDRAAAYGRQILNALTPADLPDVGGNTKLSPEDRRDILLSSVRRGVWVNNEHDDGWVLLDARRQPVTRADGSRIEFRFSEVKDTGPVIPANRMPSGDAIDATARRTGLTPEQVRQNMLRRAAEEE
ncbi:hypothetical protein AZL_025390 [Azospirillum sp. B510]|uniref:hypothetical protein n=1 Tax=Azospirillum sp. (strain B510) TaxID=137722 RepID=UPI0001C4CBE9|nr:hypothetical protein [Azospirillum sp. B510]BAI73177.1 hypothetical protein AZL_025390 [Azospirillum sp. B510]